MQVNSQALRSCFLARRETCSFHKSQQQKILEQLIVGLKVVTGICAVENRPVRRISSEWVLVSTD